VRRLAQITLAIVVLLAGALVLPTPATRVLASSAAQVPTPDLTDLLDTQSPTPRPTKKPKPPPPPGGGGGGGGDKPTADKPPSGGGGTNQPGGGGGGGGGNAARSPKNTGAKQTKVNGRAKAGSRKNGKNAVNSTRAATYRGRYNATGDFDTDKLQLVAAQLKAKGLSEDQILRAVYTPFIIGGPAAWTDTWGAPRYGPGPIVRTHEGQDVFCKYGDPVLAIEKGTIEFDEGGLGGIVARLHRGDGSYWYYAHLSDVNNKEFHNGDAVNPGDVIGYCGNTGNAISTPPHVHFGWYQASGNARNPMAQLIEWLRTAERRAATAYERITGKSIRQIGSTTSIRRFGDGFAPDISELKVSSEALIAASSSPATSAFGLADSALQQALSQGSASALEANPVSLENVGAGQTDARLLDLLESTSPVSGSSFSD
jgi:murein DD-endopeptidase MepM/ murein hydrolase activator NlpD